MKPQEQPKASEEKEGAAPAEARGEKAQEGQPQKEVDWEKTAAEYLTQLKYLAADFDNYKKSVEKQKAEWAQAGQERAVAALLPTLDELAAAVAAMKREGADGHAAQGVQMVEKNLHRVLRGMGLKHVNTQGAFDPLTMEATGFAEVAEPKKDGYVVRVETEGFLLHGKLLRPARVLVGKMKAPAAPPEERKGTENASTSEKQNG